VFLVNYFEKPINSAAAGELTVGMCVTFMAEDAPTFAALLKSECIAAGESVTFACNVTGNPAPSVEWSV
jgi:hypothetical protein